MASRDPDDKRRRLIDAGLTEFAAYGIAGARIDRIAKAADCSAGLVYTHFGSKEGLFSAVFGFIIETTVEEAPITPDDLPEYAGKLFDGLEDHPEVARFLTWQRLESDGAAANEAVEASMKHKIEAIADAQRRGTVSKRFPPLELLGLVLQLSAIWTAVTPEFAAAFAGYSRTQRRRLVTDSVAALLRD
jgi:AcrR family transcriptional regulator